MNHTNNTCCELCLVKKETRLSVGTYMKMCSDKNCPCHTPTQSWEEEHEKLWTTGSIGVQVTFGKFTSAKEIERAFITSLLAKRDAELLEEIERMIESCPDGFEICNEKHIERKAALDSLKAFITNRDKK